MISNILMGALLAATPMAVQGPPVPVFIPPVVAPPADIVPQTPAHLALADTLMTVMKVNQQQMKAVPQIVDMLMPLMVRGNEAHGDEIRALLSDEFGRVFTDHQQDMARVSRDTYARHLTDQELRDMIAFYRTPTGQRLIAVQSTITAESISGGQEVGRRAMVDAMPRIIERMRKANLKVPENP